MTQRDPTLTTSALRLKRNSRISAIFDEQFETDLHYIYYRRIYEKQKAVDHKAVNRAVKKVLPSEVIREAKKAIHNPADKMTAAKIRDIGEGLEGVLERMGRAKKPRKSA